HDRPAPAVPAGARGRPSRRPARRRRPGRRPPAGAARPARARSATPGSPALLGEEAVQLGVALVDAALHAGGEHAVTLLEGVAQRLRVQPRVAVAEVLERQRLERNTLRVALEGERLDDALLVDLVEAATEGVLLAVASRDVAPLAAVAGVPDDDLGVHAVRADPAGEQRRVGVRGQQLRGGGAEVARDA